MHLSTVESLYLTYECIPINVNFECCRAGRRTQRRTRRLSSPRTSSPKTPSSPRNTVKSSFKCSASTAITIVNAMSPTSSTQPALSASTPSIRLSTTPSLPFQQTWLASGSTLRPSSHSSPRRLAIPSVRMAAERCLSW